MDKVFLVANEKTSNVRKEKGVSMVSLVITIVVMLILLGIAFISSNDSVENAGKGIFIRELALVQQAANESKLDNQVDGTSEEIKFRGFYKTRIKNPPISFVSFSEDEIYGYVIDLEYVHTEDADRGHDYKSFAVDIESNVVEFGVDDVYVCDKDGNVFYAKGWPTSEGTYYSPNEVEGLGPIFVSINKIIAADAKSAIIRVEVKKSSSGDLSLKVDDVDLPKDVKPTQLYLLDIKQQTEIMHKLEFLQSHFIRYLQIGGFPELAISKDDIYSQRILREDIVDKAIKRDLPSIYNIRNVNDVEKVFLYLCYNSSNIINLQAICKELQVNRNVF